MNDFIIFGDFPLDSTLCENKRKATAPSISFILSLDSAYKNSFKHEDPHDLEEIVHSFQQVIKEETEDPLFHVYFDIGVNFQSTNNGYSLYWTKETTEELLSGSGLKHT